MAVLLDIDAGQRPSLKKQPSSPGRRAANKVKAHRSILQGGETDIILVGLPVPRAHHQPPPSGKRLYSPCPIIRTRVAPLVNGTRPLPTGKSSRCHRNHHARRPVRCTHAREYEAAARGLSEPSERETRARQHDRGRRDTASSIYGRGGEPTPGRTSSCTGV